jgi:predicted O-methyltransferase YrrM
MVPAEEFPAPAVTTLEPSGSFDTRADSHRMTGREERLDCQDRRRVGPAFPLRRARAQVHHGALRGRTLSGNAHAIGHGARATPEGRGGSAYNLRVRLSRMLAGWKRRLGQWLLQRQAQRLAGRLAGSSEFALTVNYTVDSLERWRAELADFAGRPGVAMLEIGSFEGASAMWFLANILTHPSARLTCIDPFDDPRQEIRFEHNLALSGARDKVEKRKATSDLVLPELERGSFDMIYVDGAHDAASVLFDAMMGWELLRPGGVMIFDDYQWEKGLPAGRRPQLAIDLFLKNHAGNYELVHKAYQVTVRKTALEPE